MASAVYVIGLFVHFARVLQVLQGPFPKMAASKGGGFQLLPAKETREKEMRVVCMDRHHHPGSPAKAAEL